MTDFKYNKDQAKKVYDQIASNGGMTSSESEFYDKLNDTEYVKKVYNTLNEDGIQLLDAPDEKSFLDSLGFNAPTTLEPTNIVKEEKTAADPITERAEEVKSEPILPVNMEPASAIVANETPEERVQGGAKQIGEDKFSDVAVVNDMLANANQELADWKNANDAFMTEFDRRKSQFADDRLAYTEQWAPRFFNKQSKKDQDFINANSAKYSELQRQRKAIQGKIDMLDTIRQYSEYDASVAKGEALSAMVDRKELSEEDMKELRSISDEKERNAYLENLRDSGKITDETFKNIYNLGDVSSKNALAYGLFKTGKLKDMATIGLTELERSINIREIAERKNNGLPLTDEESSLLDIYNNLAKIENQDRSIWFDLGKGAQQSVRFMMEMALTGGASGLGKAIGTKGILALAKQFGTKKALGMAAKNAAVRGGQSAMYQSVMTPVSPSTYIDFNNRVAGLNLEGKDISGADLLKEYYKAGVGTFADKISETMSGILDDARFLSILANSKPTNKVLQKGLELSIRLGDSQAYKVADRTLKGLGINSVPAEMLEEVGANIIKGTLGGDEKALEQLTDGEFYLQTAMQSVLFGGVGAGIRYGAGAIAASSQEKQIKKEYERAVNNLKDEQFSNERLNELKEILIDAMDNGNYVGKDGSVETGDVYSTFKQLQDEVLISGTIEDRKAFNTADNAVRFGLFNDGKNRAVKALVEQRYGEFENEDGNVYEVTDQEGNSYFILDETDNSVVLVNRATKEKVVKPKSSFTTGSVKQTNANEWALNEVLLNANKWNAEDAISDQQEIQPQQAAERPADMLYINGNAAHVVKYDPNTGIYTVLDEQGQEAEYSLNEEGVVPAWIEDNTQEKEQTETPLEEANTADFTEDNTNIIPEVQPEVETPSNELISTEGVTGEETVESTEENVEYDENGDPVWSKISPERGKQEIDSAFNEDEAKAFVADKIKEAEKAVKKSSAKKPKSTSIKARVAEKAKIKAEQETAQANLDYWNAMSDLYNAQPVEEAPVEQTEQVLKNTSDSVLPEGVTPYTVGENIKQKYNDTPKAYGAEDTYTDAEGNTYKGRWVVTEADAVTPSHNAETLQPNEGFPLTDKGRNVNDNDYSTKRGIVETMAANYDARALDEPVIVSEGAIVSGNNRTISGQIAAQNGTDTKYKEALPSKAAMRGVSAEELGKFKNPRLVFELAEPVEYTTETFAKFNRPRSKTKSPVDMAIAIGKQDTSRLVGQVLDTIGEVEKFSDLYQNQAKVATIMKQVVESGIINQNEMPQFYTEEYGVTDAGKDFIETLLIGSVINEDQIRILNSEGMKQYREKIASAMLPIAKNMKFEDNIGNRLNTAIKYLKEARDAKTDLKGILLDIPMFDAKEYEDLTIFTALMLQRKTSEFRQFINNLNERLELGGDNLFGEQESAQSVLEDYKSQDKLTDNERETIRLAEQARESATQGIYGGVQGDGTYTDTARESGNGNGISETESAAVEDGQTEIQPASGDVNLRDDRGANGGVRSTTESDSEGRIGENVQRKHYRREIDGESNGGGVSEISGEASLSNNSDVERAIKEISKKLNTPVNIYRSIEELEAAGHYDVIAALNNGLMPQGWYNGNEVGVYLPNITSTKDAETVLIHEIVAHNGIKGLLGDDANAVYDAVWNGMTQDDKIKFLRYAYMQYFNDFTRISKREWTELFPSYATLEDLRRNAADEYIAHLSAKVDFTGAEKTIWQRIVDAVKRFIKSISVSKFSDKEIEQLLKASYSRLYNTPSSETNVAGNKMFSFGGPITNKSKFGSVDKIIQHVKDNAIAIKNLQNEVIRRGGTINDDSDAYNQVPLSTKKAAFDVAYFDKAYYTPMLQQLTKAAKLFTGKGVSILDARDKVVSFLYARHAPERNKKIAIDKIKENVYGALGSQIMSNDMSDFINDIIPIIYDNSYKGGTSTYDTSSLSTEQTKVYNNAMAIINDWIAAHPIVNLSGVTDKQAKMIMHNMYDSQDAEIKAELDKLSDTIRDCNEYTLEKWLEYGLISKDEYDATKNMYQYYIPLRGWEDKENIDYEGVGGRAYNRAGDVISLNRRALGRTSKAEAPIEHIRMMAVSAAVSGNRNLIRQKAYNLIAQNADLIEDLATIDSEAYKQAKTKTQQKMHEVDVFINGDKRTYAFLGEHGVATAQAVTGKNKGDMNIVERLLSKLTRAQSMMLTSLNVAFLPVNMVRDFGYGNIAYYIKYGGKDWGKFFKNYFIGLGQSFLDVLGANPTSKNAQLYQDYKRNGGQTGFVHIEELERLKHNTNKIVRRYSNGYRKVGQQVVDLIPQLLRVIGEPMENATRFAAYKTLVERGESPRQAAIAAGEITVNFNRKGTTKAFPMMYAFFNAAMEGTRNFFDLMTGGDNAQKMRASMVMATLMATSFGLAMMAKGKGYEEDEEEFEKSLEGLSDEDKELMRIQRGFANSYNRVSPYVKNTNILIPTASKNEKGDMKFIAIPLPQSFRVINACGRILADLVSGDIKPDEAFKEMFFFSIGEFIPFDIENLDLTSTDKDNGTALQRFLRVAAPTPLRASAEIATNRDFMGNPIYRESYINSPKELNKPLFLRAYDDTPEIWVGAAEELNEWLGGSENVGAKVQTAQNGLPEDNWKTKLALFLDNTNISNPAAVDHFLKGFFGGFYTMGMKAYQWATSDEPIPAEETFIVDRFVKVPTARPGMKSYFELLDDAEESKVSIEDKEARGVDSDDKYGKMLIVVAEKSKEEIAKLNEIIYAIKGIDKPTDEQKQALKEVQKQRDEIMKLAGAAYEYIIAKAEAEKKTDETNTGNRN